MSVTTTANPLSGAVLHALVDYDVRHSGSPDHPSSVPQPEPHPLDAPQPQNPDWWPTDHRRIPDYRPINRHLDLEQRPNGINGPERLFIFTMLRGVQVNANAAYIWSKTGGNLNSTIFKYKIGGQK